MQQIKFIGTGKDFLNRYSEFEKQYQKLLATELDINKTAGVDIDFLRSGGAIDLNVLNSGARKNLERQYKEDILRIPKVFQDQGYPALQLPSSNKYRYAFKLGTETKERSS